MRYVPVPGFFPAVMRLFFRERFSYFDTFCIMVVAFMFYSFSKWWMLALIPTSIIGAHMTMRYEQMELGQWPSK